MSDLPADVQTYIVTLHARHWSPRQVVRAVQEAFEMQVTRQQVSHYDCTKAWATGRSAWEKLFKAERRRYYNAKRSEIPVAERDFRISELQELYFEAKAKGLRKE